MEFAKRIPYRSRKTPCPRAVAQAERGVCISEAGAPFARNLRLALRLGPLPYGLLRFHGLLADIVRYVGQVALVGQNRRQVVHLSHQIQRPQRLPHLLGSRIDECDFCARSHVGARLRNRADSSRNRRADFNRVRKILRPPAWPAIRLDGWPCRDGLRRRCGHRRAR